MPDGTTTDNKESSFLDTIYDEINNVIGGDNPYQYDFGDGNGENMTPEQAFCRLYGEYVDAKAEWY